MLQTAQHQSSQKTKITNIEISSKGSEFLSDFEQRQNATSRIKQKITSIVKNHRIKNGMQYNGYDQ